MTITFDNPEGLLWLIAAAAIITLGVGAALWRRRAATRFADAALVARIAPGLSLPRGIWRAALLGGAACCLGVALMDPRAEEQTEELTRRGADVMFVVDVSRSMLAEDASPNRLGRARTFISDAIDAMGGDRAGLIDFAGVAAVRAPLTLNYDALKAAVDGLESKDSRRGGSMLGDAIRLAAESFPTDDAGHAIVILSDGEDMGSDPIDAAKDAAERGIRIITVGIGDPREGARIPVGDGSARRFLVHDGEEVWSRMDSATLRDVADATGGLFVPAATAQVELGEILTRTLADIERTEGDATVARTTSPLFQWPAGLALALLVIESMVSACARRTVPERATVARGMREGKSSTSGIRRTRRTRPQRSAVGATVATAIALAAIPGPGREASAQAQVKDAPRAVDAPPPPAARRADSDTLATDAPRAKRTVGRGQIDRAAFREAVTRANAAMKASQYAEAASAFAEAMDADPTSAAAAYNKGVAEYRAGKLDDASASFSEAATRGDAALAADAMFNQGNATYQSALRALDGAPDESDPAVPAASSSNGAAAQPDLKAATDAVSKALTHYKDAIAANPGDIDSRANAELAHTLLKRLEEMQQKQQQNETQDQDKEQKQDDQEQAEQQQDGGECDNPQQGDGEGKSGGKSSDKSSDDTYPESDKDEQQAKDAGSDQQEQEDPKDKSGAEPSEPKDDQASQDRAGGAEQRDAKDPKGPEGEVKARNGAEQSTADQKPQTPGQARAGEPVPGAPLTKSEAERLLQGVRDRSKQRMEAKERAERVRQVPAVRDW